MKESICIVGAGITGLATAYVLSPKYSITIIARDLPGDLGTNWASPWYILSSLSTIQVPQIDRVSGQEQSSTRKTKPPSPNKRCKK
jgi:glycine/D-amino acid oxidase-like deaminating enzyme